MKVEWLQEKSAAQILAFVYALWLPFAGIVSIIGNPSFTVGDEIQGKFVLGQYVNGWHGLFHLIPGLIAIASWRSPQKARIFALWFGCYSLIGTVLGLMVRDSVLGVIAVDDVGNVVHGVEALLAFSVYTLSTPKNKVVASS